jgi:hypothetical protein
VPTAPRSPWPQRTTFWAGLCFVGAGLLQALVVVGFVLVSAGTLPVSVPSTALIVLAAVARAAGFVVAALGVRGEVGVVADSRLGAVALMLFGARDLVLVLLPLVEAAPVEQSVSPVVIVVNTAITALVPIAGLVAAVIVLRTRVLGGLAHWALLPVAIVGMLLVAVELAPFGDAQRVLPALPLEFLEPVLMLVLGGAFLLHGRGEAVRYRAQVIEEHW